MRKVLVVSDSAALSETVDIVLGDHFVVETVSVDQAPAISSGDTALLIVDATAPVPGGDTPVICIGDSSFRAIPEWRRRLYLPQPFDALSLREAAAMLALKADAVPARPVPPLLDRPFVPVAAAEAVSRAMAAPLPLCLWGEAGTGKLRLARALHAHRGAMAFVTAAAPEVNRADLLLPERTAAGEITLVVTGLECLDAGGQRRLLAALDQGTGDHGTVRVIATSRLDPADLARQGILDRNLFYHLGVLTIHLPPLRERSGEIATLASSVAESLCARLDLPRVSFTEGALRRLSRYLWFGNLAELEAVVARSIVFAPGSSIDARDLRFGYGTSAPPATRPSAAAASPPARKEANGVAMDLVIQELAHEFKNPMVTIKTFAHQIDHLLDRDGGHEEFARLTGEAVERMDAALENLVQYTRFEAPARQAASLGSIVTTALAGVRDCVEEKQLSLDVEPTAARVFVDPAQCGYALKNLLRTVARDLSPGDALAVRAIAPASLAIEYPARARTAATALSRLVLGDGNGKEHLPLGFTFARALIERNGGRLSLDREGEVARVFVELPMGGDGKGENGQAESLGSR